MTEYYQICFNYITLMATKIWLFSLLLISLQSFANEPNECGACHQEELNDWLKSDHSKAMAVATIATVKGDFNGTVVKHYQQKATFFKKDNAFFIRFNEGNASAEYEVKYVFGHFPLQEYLIETEAGKLQVFPFAWDARSASIGGQKWYPIYPDENIGHQDRLHWLQPLQNWNGMCADCHSSGLKRNYDAQENSFSTVWNNINVSCQSCHGEIAPAHYANSHTSNTVLSETEQKKLGNWLLGKEQKIASWAGPKRDNAFMDNCFGCHSLRTPLSDGITPNEPLLNQFKPAILSPPQYHVDGQIRDEVYVYGSFLQSKMFAAGVNCNDCHNPHSAKINIEGNGLCSQCHRASSYDVEEHHHHQPDTEGSMCVNCHMPSNTYMGVDKRRDHSFHIPSPELSLQFNTPNACNSCHGDKSTLWAKEKLQKWQGKNVHTSLADIQYMELLSGQSLSLSRHFALAKNTSLPPIKRATVVSLIPNNVQQLPEKYASPLATDSSALVRLAFADISYLVVAHERKRILLRLLKDTYKAIRIEAAEQLIALGDARLVTKSVLGELLDASHQTLWRGEGNLNASLLHANQGNYDKAKEYLKQGIAKDPYFEPNYINLANLLRSQGDNQSERAVLKQGLNANPKSALLHYAEGMRLIRVQNVEAAIQYFEKAYNLAPNSDNYLYILALALDKTGKTKLAIDTIKKGMPHIRNTHQLVTLGMNFSQKLGLQNEYYYFKQILEQSDTQ